jgi:hypothetical protein
MRYWVTHKTVPAHKIDTNLTQNVHFPVCQQTPTSPLKKRRRKSEKGESLHQHIILPQSCDVVNQPQSSPGSQWSYDLYCGKAEDDKSPIEWGKVTKVYLNNIKWREDVNYKLSWLLKRKLPVNAMVFSLAQLPFWDHDGSETRLTKGKADNEIDFVFEENSCNIDERDRWETKMPVWKCTSAAESVSWTDKPIDFYVHRIQLSKRGNLQEKKEEKEK